MSSFEFDKVDDAYMPLALVLNLALEHASVGKGAERHSTGQPFMEQPAMVNMKLLGSNQGALFQALKKIQESSRMTTADAKKDLLGAINYLAAAIIYLDENPSLSLSDFSMPSALPPPGVVIPPFGAAGGFNP